MNDQINYTNNPLHGVSLKSMLTDVVDHYGFEILFAYLNINCFNKNPSIASSVKFLKKTDWAREKVENFYLYQFKNLPRTSYEQFQLSPRDRIIPDDQKPGVPAELSLEDAPQLQEKPAQRANTYRQGGKTRSTPDRRADAPRDRHAGGEQNHATANRARSSQAAASAPKGGFNPWTKAKKS